MGRPLGKRFFGDPETPDQRNVGSETENNFRVECNVKTATGPVDTGYIVAQKGSNKFKVTDGTDTLDCRLTNKATADLLEGEMVLFGSDGTGNRIPLKKISLHKATDYNNNQYKWEIQDDSTESVVILTAL
jgi:hypothetical protein